jgi:hypothetical protein
MINTYLEFGLAQIEYSGANIGSFLEIEVDNNNGKIEHLYFEGINPSINNGMVPSNPGLYRGGSINELIDWKILDNTVSSSYTPNYTFKARFIDEMPYLASTSQTISMSHNVVDTYYNLSNTCTLTIGATTIKLTFYYNCWVYPNKKSFSGYKYQGPLEDFSSILSCLCGLESYIGSNNSNLNEIKDLLEDFRLTLNDYSGTVINKPTSICDQLTELENALNEFIIGKPVTNLLDEKKINKLEEIFLKIFSEIRRLAWQFSGPEFGCPWPVYQTKSQKGNLYLQATGFNGDQGTVYEGMPKGIYLRWAFQNGHIPKGRLKVQNYGPFTPYREVSGRFLKNDYVYIYRTLYTGEEFKSIIPISTGNSYLNHSSNNFTTSIPFRSNVTFGFNDSLKLSTFFTNFPSATLFSAFTGYNDYIELTFENLCFAFEIDFEITQGASIDLKIETISKNIFANEYYISSRQTNNFQSKGSNVTESFRVENDSIEKVRIQFINGTISPIPITVKEIRYETYDDFEGNTPKENWTLLGNQSLTINDELAIEKRLKDVSRGIILEKKWPKFIEGVLVKEQNYEDKWKGTNTEPGLKKLLIKYLRDEFVILENATDGYDSGFDSDLNQMEISIEQTIQSILLDFHFARMLGMGYIDTSSSIQADKRYIYKAVYNTTDRYTGRFDDQIYLSLPTGLNDNRSPLNPDIQLNYGFENGNCDGKSDFDELGYSKFEKRRIINFDRQPLPFEKSFLSFFQTSELFNLGKNTIPVLLGLKYTPPASFTSYEYNSITNFETDVLDYKKAPSNTFIDVRETQPIINSLGKVFSHHHLENGDYEYCLYGIDWFGKFPINLINGITVSTEFTLQGILKPPTQIHSHYIQFEETPILSTLSEQDDLESRNQINAENDNVFTRVKFGVNHIHKINFQSASHVEIFFRKDPIGFIQGKIKSVTENTTSSVLTIENFQIFSTNVVGSSNIEDLTEENCAHYIGSKMTTATGAFEIIDIEFLEGIAQIEVKNIGELVLNQSNKVISKQCIYHSPKVKEQFSIEENWSKIDSSTKLPNNNWQLLNQVIHLTELDLTNQNIEQINGEQFFIGGFLQEDATFLKIDLSNSGTGAELEYNNYYKFTLDFQLPNHSQTNVNWQGGLLRVFNTDGEYYDDFEVLAFEENSLNPNYLDVYIIDESGLLDWLSAFTIAKVNFHPYYKVYLEPEVGITDWFKKENLLPNGSELTKETYLAFRTVYSDATSLPLNNNNNFRFSQLSVPIPLISFAESKVYKQDDLIGATYASKPDFYGNSSYNIDLVVGANGKPVPFSLVYSRTTWRQVLSELYLDSTINDILLSIAEEDVLEFANNIMSDLVNAEIYDGENLKSYSSFIMVEPNKDIWGAEGLPTIIDDRKKLIKAAIDKSFFAIHEQPIVLDFLKNGEITSNESPVIRDKGQLIPFSLDEGSKFNPHPYARKFLNAESKQIVRFTDYKIPGSSNDVYFYQVKELGHRNNLSESSPTLGPVYPRNTFPPTAPVINSFEIIPGNIFLDSGIKVSFVVGKTIEANKIVGYKLYRTTSANEDGRLSIMKLVNMFLIGEDIVDDFSDLNPFDIPFDTKLYYRIAAVRNIEIPGEPIEEVLSNPSQVMEIKLYDGVNPNSPAVTFSCDGNLDSGKILDNVELSFGRTTYKGKYYLYELNSSGNWQLFTGNSIINPIINDENSQALNFNLGDVTIKDEDGNYLYKRYKISVENCSGLLSLSDLEYGLTNFYVPQPNIIGPKINCTNQSKIYKSLKSKASNTLVWLKDGNSFANNNVEEITLSWNSIGAKTLSITETDVVSGISISTDLTILVKDIPSPSIIGEQEVLVNTPTIFQSTNTSGNYYFWESDEYTQIESQGSNETLVTFSTDGNKELRLTESNGGCTQMATFQITVYDIQFSGNLNANVSSQELYQVFNFPGFTFQWEVDPSFGSIIGQNNNEQVLVNWNQQGSANLTLTINTSLGTTFNIIYVISIV